MAEEISGGGVTNIANYTFNALGNRVKKFVSQGSLTIKMLYDGADCVADYNNDLELQRYYITPMLDENMIINVADGGSPDTDYYYTHDGLGTVREILNSSQTTVNSYDFEAFGTSKSTTEAITNRFKFTGRELDTETGSANSTALYYYRARTYDSETGTFSGKDPVHSVNLYNYVSNKPTLYTDSLGLFECNVNDPEFQRKVLEYMAYNLKDDIQNCYSKSNDIDDTDNKILSKLAGLFNSGSVNVVSGTSIKTIQGNGSKTTTTYHEPIDVINGRSVKTSRGFWETIKNEDGLIIRKFFMNLNNSGIDNIMANKKYKCCTDKISAIAFQLMWVALHEAAHAVMGEIYSDSVEEEAAVRYRTIRFNHFAEDCVRKSVKMKCVSGDGFQKSAKFAGLSNHDIETYLKSSFNDKSSISETEFIKKWIGEKNALTDYYKSRKKESRIARENRQNNKPWEITRKTAYHPNAQRTSSNSLGFKIDGDWNFKPKN